ncbi:hypothetical protein SAMN05421783_12729 [Thiocapsa roseopersicina]|uniref:Uncharacterized protein n=2 Tax=Thiocapsa roseopersicina TaxID=1058 RepID=A0A1H3BW80_THIRO|nr:hypothetical protein SAMN05421783_12729 [Thiocapsa roseopersicina]
MERALKLDPHEPSYWANLAACYSIRGDHEKAINTAKRMPMEEGHRSYTMKGNVFRAAGLDEAAIEQYLLALEHDARFELPIANGLSIAASCGRWDLVEKFDTAIDGLETPSINLMIAKAERLADRGYVEGALEIYQGQLAPEGRFVIGINQSDDITLIPNNPAKDLSDWYWNFGKHLLVSSRWHDLVDLFEFLKSPIGKFLRTGDHMVLEAEFLRLRGKWDEARSVLDQVNAQITREISRILLALDEDDIASAANRLLEIPSECPGQDSEDFKFWLGNCGPVLRSLSALVAFQQGDAVLADKESAEALAYANSGSFSDWVRVQVIEQTAPLSESRAVALGLLQRHPGNPQLIEWVVNRHLEAEDIDRAAETLQQFRPVLEGSGRRDTAAFLGEQVALRRAGANGSIKLREWPWIDQFTEPTRGWLTAAGTQAADVGWLRLSVTLLLAKVFEREFYLRIAQPFANACKFDNQGIEPEIREFVYALERGRTPSLGMIQHALWAAQLRPDQGDSSLMISWRRHLAEISWSGAVKLRDKAWLRWLSKLTQARNRAAHAGDITQSEFEMILTGFVIDDAPGPALTVLGIGLEDKNS